MRVLIVEDETRLAANIALAIEEGPGYAVDLAEDGEMGYYLAQDGVYDLLVLDLMLPKMHGIEVLRRLRARHDRTPVLILTAMAEKSSIIELLNAGADDYLGKPFDLGELIARIKALIRRGKGVAHPTLTHGSIEVDTLENVVRRYGQPVELSPSEYRVLEYLMHRPRALVSKRELLEHLYDYNWERHSNVIEVHVSNLRRKLDPGGEKSLIQTVWGRGYRLCAEDEE